MFRLSTVNVFGFIIFAHLFILLLSSSIMKDESPFVAGQITTTTAAPGCLCAKTCEGTKDPLSPDFIFEITISNPYYFNRDTFRRAVGSRLFGNQFAVVDKGITNNSFRFAFAPSFAPSTTANTACVSINVASFLSNYYTCCMHNTTDTTTGASDTAADAARASHQGQLIAGWVSIALATVYLVYQQKKAGSGAKDYAMEAALDMATQKDPDED